MVAPTQGGGLTGRTLTPDESSPLANAVTTHQAKGGAPTTVNYAVVEHGSFFDAAPLPFDTTQCTSKANRSHPKHGDPSHPLASGAHAPAIAYRTSGNCGPFESVEKTHALNTATDPNQNIIAYGINNDKRAIPQEEQACTLRAGERSAPAVAVAFKESQIGTRLDDVHATLDANKGSRRMEGVVSFKPSHFTRCKDGSPSETVPPLSADADKGDQEAVIFEPGRIARRAGPAGEQHQCSTLRSEMGDIQPALRIGMAVRRLTPTECERLQGFPDGWTAGFSDSARYRMLGNAVAVPVVAWKMRRIARLEGIQT